MQPDKNQAAAGAKPAAVGPHMLSLALYYGGAGIHVFPVNGKTPLTAHGFHDASIDRKQIEAWWTRHPDAGIGTPDFDAVDVDLYKPDCAETWQRIKPLIPEGTPCNKTGGGGLQFLFQAGTLKDGKIGPGVDSRYAGRNYIVLPPSQHPSGSRYETIVNVLTRRPKPAPEFPITSGDKSEFGQLAAEMDAGEKISDGRNKAAWWRAVKVLESFPTKVDLAPVEALVQSWVNANCAGNLAEVDVRKQVRGAARFVADKPARAAVTPHLTVSTVDNVEMRSISFLEKPLWQRSAFQLLAGAKGAGKGTYLAGLAARLSRDGKSTLFVSSEDSIQIDLKPRLVAAGLSPGRVFYVQNHLKLPEDVGWLLENARRVDELALIVIDPVANHIGNRNSNNDAEVRDAIAPLNKLADELDCLVIGVRHPGKDRSRGAVASILGSTAWVDTPRAVVMVAVDDEDEDIRHIQVVAGNRSRNGSAQSFRIEEADVGLGEPVTRAVELGESAKSVDTLLSARPTADSKSAEARELILDIIEGDGEQESDTLDARVSRETGLAAQTIRNVRAALKNEGLIRALPEKDEMGTILRWMISRTAAPRL
jgi:Bifunctional DNA primase/polymerase, N-terminal/AAA domain